MASKKTRRIGVEIGSTEVRVAEISGMTSTGKVVVSRMSSSPLRPGAVVAGEIRDAAAAAAALDRAFSLAGVPRHGFVIGLAGVKSGVARTSQASGLEPHERVTAAKHQKLSMPASLDLATSDLAVSVTRDTLSAERKKTSEVVFAAADSASVDILLKVCQLAKLAPRAVDLSAAATTRAYTRLPEDDQSAALIVDIGHTMTTVIARYGPSLVYVDTIANFAGNFLTQAVQQSTGTDMTEAQQRKEALRLVATVADWGQTYEDKYGTGDMPIAQRDSREQLTDRDLSDAADQIIDQISNSVNTALGYIPSGTAQSMFLVGGTARLIGLPDRMETALGIRAQRALPWAEIEAHKRNLEYFLDGTPSVEKQNPVVLTAFATAIGLAQWRDNA